MNESTTTDAALEANPSGYYSAPRSCETCGETFSGRNDYWTHRLAHEARTDSLVARSDTSALDALTRALALPKTEHRIRHYVYGIPGDRSTLLPRTAGMRGAWACEAKCSCGWETRTGGAVRSYIAREVAAHVRANHSEQDRATA